MKYLLWKNCKSFDCEPWYGFPGQLEFLRWLEAEGNEYAIVDFELEVPEFTVSDFNLVEIERRAILQALEKTDYEQQRAAELLGISARTMNHKVKLHKINHPSWRRKN